REQRIPLGELSQKAFESAEARDMAMRDFFRDHRVEMVVDAGYDRIHTRPFLDAFANRLINVHPSLLPQFAGGMDAIERAFARGLQRLGYELFATGSTLKVIEDAALDARPVSELTGFPEMMDGRIKTLHPGVHAGILARRDKPEHLAALAEHGLRQIDLVCCNLYPFVDTVHKPDATFEEAIEQIDIGGPTLTRAAAKHHESLVVIVRP